jgi:hypothetical protein
MDRCPIPLTITVAVILDFLTAKDKMLKAKECPSSKMTLTRGKWFIKV